MKYYLLLFIGLSICSCNQKNTNVHEENPITQLVSITELCTLMLQLKVYGENIKLEILVINLLK